LQEEKKAVTGTPVTEAVFFAWKKQFDAEMAARRARDRSARVEDKRRRTGTPCAHRHRR
jgi:hypothetical protein